MKKKTTKKQTVVEVDASGEELVTFIAADSLVRSDDNRVVGREVILALMDSIKAVGILQPLVVREHPTTAGFYQIVAGESRWRAAMEIDPEYPMPCVVRKYTDAEAVRARAIENFQRTDLTPLEEAQVLESMVVEGWPAVDIAEWVGRSPAYVSQRLALLKLPEEGKAAVEAGHMTAAVGVAIARLDEDQRAAAVAAVVKPALSKSPLPQEKALEMVELGFAKPAREAFEWEAKRAAVEAQFPGAAWVQWEQATSFRNWNSGYEPVDAKVSCDSDSPTWGELAEKHGAGRFIGVDHEGNPALYVLVEPLKVAELAAFEDDPEECPFEHPGAKKARELRHEKERLQEEARRGEYSWVREKLLASASISAAEEMTIVEQMLWEVVDVWDEDEREVMLAYLRAGKQRPFEALARLMLAEVVENLTHEALLHLATKGLGLDARELPAVSALVKELAEKKGDEE